MMFTCSLTTYLNTLEHRARGVRARASPRSGTAPRSPIVVPPHWPRGAAEAFAGVSGLICARALCQRGPPWCLLELSLIRLALRRSPSHPHEKIIGRLLTVSTGTPRVSFLALQERVEQGDAEAGEDVVALRRGRLVAEDVAELGNFFGEAVAQGDLADVVLLVER